MPRAKTPAGKTVTVCAKVSEDDAALIDGRLAALGMTRSAWLQSLIADDLADVTDGGAVAGGIRLRVDPKMPRGKVALVSPGATPVVFRAPPEDDCPHPKGVRQKDGTYCPRCGTGGLTS